MNDDIYLVVCCLALIVLIWLADGSFFDVTVLDQRVLGVE